MGDEKYYILGTLCRSLLMGAEAKMFSYNGVVLPKLPEWDKSKYPYAVLHRTTAMLCLAESIEYVTGDSGARGVRVKGYFRYSKDAGAWLSFSPNDSSVYFPMLAWSNFDLLNEDGTVYLKASEPVPVYD